MTHDNIENFRKQLHMLGYSFDWDREVNTTDPSYYKWTQWIFLQMFKKGLAYKASMPVNWCTRCKIVLANEEVVEGVCERCGGEGIGRFQRMLADYGEPLADILPGFHDIRFRFRQWDDALARDAAGRRASVAREIEWIECRRDEMLRFWQRVETGEIPRRVTHNDTKINNILFDRQGRVLCVIDLDTVLRSPCFNDFGDAIRTYANHGREDDEHLDDVWLDMAMFRSFTEGYLSEARAFLTPAETDALAFSVRYITYEQVLRFLMDYLDGDTYYKIKSPDHNLVRTRAQYALLRSAEERYDAMRAIVAELAARP